MRNNISRSQKYLIAKKQCWKCNLCGCKLRMYNSPESYGKLMHIDHIIPVSKWKHERVNSKFNLQALCFECNLKKKDKLNEQVLEILPLYEEELKEVKREIEFPELLENAVEMFKNWQKSKSGGI